MRRPMLPISVLLAVALVAAGCGPTSSDKSSATKFSGEQRAVATTIEDFQDAGSKGKQDEICDHLLSKSLVDGITAASKKSCSDAMDKALKDVDAFELTVLPGSVKITGTTATAKVKSKNGSKSNVTTMTLVKEGGRWKISELSSAPPAS